MSFLITYILQVTCISGLLYGYYHLALRNKQFHQYNRFYLLGSVLLSIILPLLRIPVYFSQVETEESLVLQTLTVISSTAPEENVTATSGLDQAGSFSTGDLLIIIYACVAFIVLTRIVFSLLKIRRMIRKFPAEKLDNIHFINTTEPGTPFSFFRWMFWNRDIALQSEKGEQIFRHELFHIQQKHSLDIMLMEVITTICWINPFFHLVKKELRAIHEFLADRFAITENRKWEYAELLLMQAFNTRQQLVNPFFHNQIKRRIAMITTSQKPSYRYVRKLMVLPIAAAVAGIFAFSYRSKPESGILASAKPITVVIDAGHGGTDKGAISAHGIAEKDLVLAIAKKIKALNTDPNISIVLTRDEDVLPKLRDRTTLASDVKPDLFLSLHVNAAADKTSLSPKSSIEIWLPKDEKNFGAESRILGAILLNYLHPVFSTKPVIKQAETGIWVLDKAPCPAALVELGFIENQKEMAILADPVQQDEIAKKILQSIDQYMVQKSSADWDERKKKMSGTAEIKITEAVARQNPGFVVDDSVTIEASTIDYRNHPEDTFKDPKPGLYIINGKRMKGTDIKGHYISAKSLTVYKANSPAAIKKYGEEARHGVMVFSDATISDDVPEADTTKPRVSPGKVFQKVEVEPSFPGGDDGWKRYLKNNLVNDVSKGSGLKDGTYTVAIQFIVDEEGFISDIKPLTKHGHGLETEAIRVIKVSPKWSPALQNGRKVTAYKKQFVTFIVGKGEIKPGTGISDNG